MHPSLPKKVLPLLGQVPQQSPMEKIHLNPALVFCSVRQQFQFSKGVYMVKTAPKKAKGWTPHSLHNVLPHQFAVLTFKVVADIKACCRSGLVCFFPFCSCFWYLKTIWTKGSPALPQVWLSHLNWQGTGYCGPGGHLSFMNTIIIPFCPWLCFPPCTQSELSSMPSKAAHLIVLCPYELQPHLFPNISGLY